MFKRASIRRATSVCPTAGTERTEKTERTERAERAERTERTEKMERTLQEPKKNTPAAKKNNKQNKPTEFVKNYYKRK